MSSSDKSRGNLANGSPPPVGTDAYAAWLERMQRTRGRHAAITKNLYTWSSYKHWADKVKGSWEEEPVPAPDQEIARVTTGFRGNPAPRQVNVKPDVIR